MKFLHAIKSLKVRTQEWDNVAKSGKYNTDFGILKIENSASKSKDVKRLEVQAEYSCTLCEEMISDVKSGYSHEKMHQEVMKIECPDYVFEPLIIHVQSQQFLR